MRESLNSAWQAGRGDRRIAALAEEADISAGDNKTGIFVAQEQALAGQQVAAEVPAFHAGITGPGQAAETGKPVSFTVDMDF